MLILSLALLGAAMAAPSRRSCNGDELLGGDACAGAQLDSIISTHLSTEMTNVDDTLEGVTSDLISVFKSFADSTADVNLTVAGSLATASWASLETALSTETSKSASFETEISTLQSNLDAKVLSLETALSTTDNNVAASTASLQSDISTAVSQSESAEGSLQGQLHAVSRCIHGTAETYFGGTRCTCDTGYSGTVCDIADHAICQSAYDMQLFEQTLAGVRVVTDLRILGECPGQLLTMPPSVVEITSLEVDSTQMTDMNIFMGIQRFGTVKLSGAIFHDMSGMNQAQSVESLTISGTNLASVDLSNLQAPFDKVVIEHNDHLGSIHVDTAVSSNDCIVEIANNQRVTVIQGFSSTSRMGALSITNNPKLKTIDAFKFLSFAGSDTTGGLTLHDNPYLAGGAFLSNGVLSGTTLDYHNSGLTLWLFDRVAGTWNSFSFAHTPFHGTCPTVTNATDPIGCSCDNGYWANDCTTLATDGTFHASDIDFFYSKMHGVVHAVSFTFHGLRAAAYLTDPKFLEASQVLETIGDLTCLPNSTRMGSSIYPEGPYFQNLHTITGTLAIQDNNYDFSGGFTERLPALANVGTLKLENFPSDTVKHDPPITYGSLDLSYINDQMTFDFSESFPHLYTLENLRLANIPHLTSLIPLVYQLQHITGNLEVTEIDMLYTISSNFMSLQHVGNTVKLYNNTQLTDIIMVSHGDPNSWFLTHRNSPCGTSDWYNCPL
eukprot:m.89670 g.89670  ORF g.89670 m.89670 type:complete len:724 (-) comp14863_c0_seq1:94-2265(-)